MKKTKKQEALELYGNELLSDAGFCPSITLEKTTTRIARAYDQILRDYDRVQNYPMETRFYAAETESVRKLYKSKAWEKISNDSVAQLSHDSVNWGRLRKHSSGVNTGYGAYINEKDNGKQGWHRVVWRYANYCLLASKSHKTILYKLAGYSKYKRARLTLRRARIEGKLIEFFKSPLKENASPIRTTCRIARKYVKSLPFGGVGLDVGQDKMGVFVADIRNREVYHIQNVVDIKLAVKMLAVRRKEKKINEAEKKKAALTIVTFEDSLRSGNCIPGTNQFIEKVKGYFQNWTPTMLPGDLTLHFRNDAYTQRAVREAIQREAA